MRCECNLVHKMNIRASTLANTKASLNTFTHAPKNQLLASVTKASFKFKYQIWLRVEDKDFNRGWLLYSKLHSNLTRALKESTFMQLRGYQKRDNTGKTLWWLTAVNLRHVTEYTLSQNVSETQYKPLNFLLFALLCTSGMSWGSILSDSSWDKKWIGSSHLAWWTFSLYIHLHLSS